MWWPLSFPKDTWKLPREATGPSQGPRHTRWQLLEVQWKSAGVLKWKKAWGELFTWNECLSLFSKISTLWLPRPSDSNNHILLILYIAAIILSISRVRLFATLWTAACQASLSYTISQSLLKLMSIELVMPSNHLVLCHPSLLLPSIFPSIKVFSNEVCSHQVAKLLELQLQHQWLPVNFQDWFPLGLTLLISLQSKGLSRVFSNITVQKH